MKNLLLTGSSGFVGNYFINNYSNKYNINTFSFLKNHFEELDLSSIDIIIHLSALVHQMGGASENEYEKVNVIQTLNLAKKAKNSGVKHFIFMSTVKVYGEETNIAYSENSDCFPQDDYGKSKLKAEFELQKLEDENFKISIIRTPIVYGYGVKANIKNLIKLVEKIPILPFGKIKNRRSMVYIGNLCYVIDLISEKNLNGIFLASDNQSVSTTKLIELIAKELNKKVYLIRIPLFESLLRLLKPSFQKRLYESLEIDNKMTMKKLFGNSQVLLPYSIEEGVKFMIIGENK